MWQRLSPDQWMWVMLTVLYCAITLVVVLRSRFVDSRHTAWTALAILLITLLLVGLWPTWAGTVGIILWLLFLLIPGLIQRLTAQAVAGYHFARAERLVMLLQWLQPFGVWQETRRLMRALNHVQRGEHSVAATILQHYTPDTAMGRSLLLQLFRMQQRWAESVALTDDAINVPDFGCHSSDLSVITLRLRALGEIGDLNRLVATFVAYQPLLQRATGVLDQARLFVFAYCARQAAFELLMQQRAVASWPVTVRAYWRAVLSCALGDVTQGRAQMTQLAMGEAGLVRDSAQAYLRRIDAATPPIVAAAQLTPATMMQIGQVEQDYWHALEAAGGIARNREHPLATYLMVALNLLFFGVEIVRGALNNAAGLYDLGAMAPIVVWLDGAWWRLLSATFLHVNLTHLAFNMLALWFLGRMVEAKLGPIRFLIVYLLSGVLSMGIYIVLLQLELVSLSTIIVGASGSIMGLIGAEAAILFRLWRSDASQVARQYFLRAVIFVLLQASLDLLIPHFSFVGHLSGAIFGFILAALLYRRQPISLPTMAPAVLPSQEPTAQ